MESCLARNCAFYPRSFLKAGLAGGRMLAALVSLTGCGSVTWSFLTLQILTPDWLNPEVPAYPSAI